MRHPASGSDEPNKRIAKQEKRLIVLCIAVAGIMLLSIVRHLFR
ncbi:hypothetical protein [Paenibacillus koleovorans]|nr:hypothetical protein [Paenibacillus koleovorans]